MSINIIQKLNEYIPASILDKNNNYKLYGSFINYLLNKPYSDKLYLYILSKKQTDINKSLVIIINNIHLTIKYVLNILDIPVTDTYIYYNCSKNIIKYVKPSFQISINKIDTFIMSKNIPNIYSTDESLKLCILFDITKFNQILLNQNKESLINIHLIDNILNSNLNNDSIIIHILNNYKNSKIIFNINYDNYILYNNDLTDDQIISKFVLLMKYTNINIHLFIISLIKYYKLNVLDAVLKIIFLNEANIKLIIKIVKILYTLNYIKNYAKYIHSLKLDKNVLLNIKSIQKYNNIYNVITCIEKYNIKNYVHINEYKINILLLNYYVDNNAITNTNIIKPQLNIYSLLTNNNYEQIEKYNISYAELSTYLINIIQDYNYEALYYILSKCNIDMYYVLEILFGLKSINDNNSEQFLNCYNIILYFIPTESISSKFYIYKCANHTTYKIIDVLLAYTNQLNLKNELNQSFAHFIAMADNIILFKWLIWNKPNLLYEKDIYNRTPLLLAFYSGNIKFITEVLIYNSKLLTFDVDILGNNCLHYMAQYFIYTNNINKDIVDANKIKNLNNEYPIDIFIEKINKTKYLNSHNGNILNIYNLLK